MPRTSRNPYDQYSLAEQERRDIAFAISSEKVVGARYVDGWDVTDPRPTGFAVPSGYLTVDTIAAASDPDGGWTSVPSQRLVKKRERRTAHRRERDVTSTWLGRGDEPGASLVEIYNRRTDWVPRKDGSHELVIR